MVQPYGTAHLTLYTLKPFSSHNLKGFEVTINDINNLKKVVITRNISLACLHQRHISSVQSLR